MTAVKESDGMLNSANKQRDCRADQLSNLMAWPVMSVRIVPVEDGERRVRLENAVWDGLDAIAQAEGLLTKQLCAKLDARRSKNVALSSEIRSFVLDYFRGNDEV
ncbi:ribbon-helix-helix domain-containing protein [Azospirillum sp. TSA2s]|uniref:ribbon-helix-helix domain-containing protein n=1 Tax=Azospirillum sp. TSA2s TaxID=709810 RepID=UPI001FFEB97E|nr:ribbon-helix-helix domain-containing protein [Azospirillum sp. TSA2s]